MARSLIALAFAVSVPITLAAQSLISPSYYAQEEANSSSYQPLFRSAGQVYQQIHDTLRGSPRTINGLVFRQDSPRVGSFSLEHPWWSEFEILMAGGVYAGASTVPANNYATPPTRVFYNRRHVVPQWLGRPPVSPTPFTLVIPLDQPYVHSGTHALLFQFNTTADAGPYYCNPADAFRGVAPRSWPGEGFGWGCTQQVPPYPGMRLDAVAALGAYPASSIDVTFTASGWVPATPGATLLGVRKIDEGLYTCAPLRVDPLIVLPSAPLGNTLVTQLIVPCWAELAGPTLYAQAVVPDPALTGYPVKLRLSNAVSLRLPRDAAPDDSNVLRVRWEIWPEPARFVVEQNSGLVTEFR